MASLYELTAEMLEIDNYLEFQRDLEETEETKENIEKAEEYKKALQELLDTKAENIIKYVKNLEGLVNSTDEEIKRLNEVKKRNQKKIEKLKENVLDTMLIADKKKIETTLGIISTRKSPVSVEVENMDIIPLEYIKTEVVNKVDKKAIIENFKENGEILTGVKMITDKYTLTLK